jgi:DNA polymerase delta subunit 1
VLCSSRDCPIFYKRKKIQRDLKETRDTLARFGETAW